MKRKYGLSPLQRIERYRIYNNNCWEVTISPKKVYPQLKVNGENLGIHRIVYEALIGPIPIGCYVLHRCDNPRCHNPAHLYAGTLSENMRDMWSRGRHPTNQRRIDVDLILMLQQDNSKSQKQIAAEAGCTQTAVSVLLREKGLSRGKYTSFGKNKAWITRKHKRK
jgi:hypothetical protein